MIRNKTTFFKNMFQQNLRHLQFKLQSTELNIYCTQNCTQSFFFMKRLFSTRDLSIDVHFFQDNELVYFVSTFMQVTIIILFETRTVKLVYS